MPIVWLGVEGPSTYSPTFSCNSPARAETGTDELVTTSPSDGEVISPGAICDMAAGHAELADAVRLEKPACWVVMAA
ncbi:hypothetical protein ABZW11_11895 [Nonomuraea sp. NPDC004580]|uniref:hypothetical protein n=1 Tax=Nonomuraea sp. NPDC004580 TaxID=3154552 RepID=UPI0033B306CC